MCFLSPLSVWRSGVSRAPNRCSCREEAESTRIDIAARVSGRLANIAVRRGQNVAAGATLLVIDNPELVAELRQPEAEKTVADAELQRIKVGTRAEIIAQRKAEIDRAPADLTLGQQTYNRTKQLAAHQFAAQSKLDEDAGALTLALRRLDEAKLAYDEAVRGFTAEEHEIAEANVGKAAAKVDTVKAFGIAAAYAIGTEFSRPSRRAWLRRAGGNPLIAFGGGLAERCILMRSRPC